MYGTGRAECSMIALPESLGAMPSSLYKVRATFLIRVKCKIGTGACSMKSEMARVLLTAQLQTANKVQ